MSENEATEQPEQEPVTDSAEETQQSAGEQPDASVLEEVAAELAKDESGVDAAALQLEVAELQERLLRSQAEMENFRRRTQKEAQDAARYQSVPLIRDLLPFMDNLQRAIDAAEQTGDTQNLIEGIKMVSAQLEQVVSGHNAKKIDPAGQPFDPNEHEALSQVPSPDHEPMTVIQVVEAGYRIHERIVRPAKVIVSCAPPEPAPQAEESSE